MKISIITVCHKSRQKLASYICSFLEHHRTALDCSQYQFVFVENSGEEGFQGAVQPLADAGFEVQVLYTENMGFGRGCNDGAARATGDLLVFANPDIRFLSNLSPLLKIAAPQYWGTVRQVIAGGRRISIDLLPEHKGILFEVRRLYPLTDYLRRWLVNKSYVPGAFLILSKELFARSGGFHPAFFLYYEEAELAHRLHALCGPPKVETSVSIFHEEFGSHSSRDDVYPHEAQGFLTYCRLTGNPKLIGKRLRTLRVLACFSAELRKRLRAHEALLAARKSGGAANDAE